MHWLPNFSAPSRMSSGRASALELMLILSAPARSIVYMSSMDFDAAADSERHEALVSAARSIASTIVPRPCAVAVMSKKTISVRALVVVAQGQFHGVADIAQAALFGHAELDTARDMAVVDVEARDDTFGNHLDIETRQRHRKANANSRTQMLHRFSLERPAPFQLERIRFQPAGTVLGAPFQWPTMPDRFSLNIFGRGPKLIST